MPRAVRILLAAVAVLLACAVPAYGATGCDATGDARSADDCVRHAHVGASMDSRVRGGETITLRQRLHPSLRGTTIVSRIQVRHAPKSGRKGPWIEIRRHRWTPGARGTLDIRACRAKLAGRYQFRTVVTPAAAPRAGLLARTTAPLATSGTTTVTLPASQTGCTNSPDDESNIEYFNLQNFNAEYLIEISDLGTAFSVQLECPERESPDIPSTSYGIALTLLGQQTGVGCTYLLGNAGNAIVLQVADLQRGAYPECEPVGSRYQCEFAVVVYNTVSGTTYGTTEVQLVLEAAQVIPELEPATLPICDNTLNDCLITGACPLSSNTTGKIQLCESPAPCTTPSSTTATTGSSIYFQTVS